MAKKKTWVVVTSAGNRLEVAARHLSSASGDLMLHNRRKTTTNRNERIVLIVPAGRWVSVERKRDTPVAV